VGVRASSAGFLADRARADNSPVRTPLENSLLSLFTLFSGRTTVVAQFFSGLGTPKLKISVAVANGARNGEVRFFGDISSEPVSVASMVNKLSKGRAKLHFCYKAGPIGYGLYRQIIDLGLDCVVVARRWCRSDRATG
jgi:hypothetical protein